MKQLLLSLSFLLFFLQTIAQQQTIEGKIIDASSKEPLAFVNVIYGNPPRGTTTNIDGNFSLTIKHPTDILKISYIGYHTKKINIPREAGKHKFEIALKQKRYSLDSVVIKPQNNQADRIIHEVWKNQSENNPNSLQSYSYRTYNKMVFTFDTTSISKNDASANSKRKTDSSDIKLQKLMKNQHLFLTESVSKKEYLKPDKTNEKVLASRVSGFKDPSLVFMASQFQSFSFYDEFIQIGDYNYLNPVSKNSSKRYLFQLEDTLFTENMDTVYMISFRPKKGKNFDALQGILHVHTNNYALQTVIAEPSDPLEELNIRIQQKYELIDGQQWFPVQLNTRIDFREFERRTENYIYSLIGDGKTYLKDIKLNPDLDPEKFDPVALNIPDSVDKKEEKFWQSKRIEKITERERRTYEILDSVGKKNNFDRGLQRFRLLSKGYYPIKFLNLDIEKFLGYNQYEGWRLGAGFMTNDKLSSTISVGGYIGYGLKDEKYKYGGRLLLTLDEGSESHLDLSYTKDVRESGGYSFLDSKKNLSSTELFRRFMVKSMFYSERYESGYSFRSFDFLKTRFYFQHSRTSSFDNYALHTSNEIYQDHFLTTETGLQFRYAYAEEFLKTPWGKFSQGTDYPVLYGNIRQAVNLLDGDFTYTKLEGRIEYDFLTRSFGTTNINLVGGIAEGEVPLFKLYNGHGSYEGRFTFQVDNSFATMRMNEFYADKFISVFFKQNFGSLLLKTEYFKPRISFVSNAGWGTLDNKAAHRNMTLESFSKGFYESGILIENLLSANFFSYGAGIYYRYGPYGFNKPANNLAYKFCFRFKLGNK
jgi:hypothetical protein